MQAASKALVCKQAWFVSRDPRQHSALVCRWIAQQQQNLKNARIAVLYASAYGNTAALAQAISRGITKAGVGVETVNLEQVELQEAEKVLGQSQGFVIGARARCDMFASACIELMSEWHGIVIGAVAGCVLEGTCWAVVL